MDEMRGVHVNCNGNIAWSACSQRRRIPRGICCRRQMQISSWHILGNKKVAYFDRRI